MPIQLTKGLINTMRSLGVSTALGHGTILPDDMVLEPPCSLKLMQIQHSLHMGAFSYAVSGFYFGCRIGRYCSFAENVQIGRHPHPMHYFSTSPFFYWVYDDILNQHFPPEADIAPLRDFKRNSPHAVAKMTMIGNDVWIGDGAFILPGVKIGNGAAIAARSVVTKDVPPYALVAGVPAKVIRYRFQEDQIEALLASRWWEFAPWQLKGATVDDIPAFLEFIAKLRSSGESAYTPEQIKLGDLVDDEINN